MPARLARALALSALLALPSVAPAIDVPPGDLVDQTWTVAGSPYHVTGDVTVPAGHFLHIEAGVEVHFATGDAAGGGIDAARAELVVGGELVASGTTTSPVKLLADAGDAAPASSWYGVVVASGGTATLASTDVSSGVDCLRIASTSAVSVTGGVIQGCVNGVDVVAGAPTLGGVEITGCGTGIRDGGGNTLLATHTTATGLHIHHNIQSGVQLGYSDFTLSDSLVHDNGSSGVSWLLNDGTHTLTVTGSTLAYNANHGIYLYPFGNFADLTAQIHDCVVAFNGMWGIASNLGGSVHATHDVVWGNGIGYGDLGLTADRTGTMIENPLFVDGPGRDLGITSRSPARGHASDGGDIGYFAWAGALTPVLAGHLFEDLTFTAAGSPHDVVGDLTVEPGHTLTVEPGAAIRFAMTDHMGGNSSPTKTELRVEGTLDAAGTPAQPISFLPASLTHAAGDWDGIHLLPSAAGSVVDHAEIGYAVHGVRSDADGTNLVARSDVHHSSTHGILTRSGATVFDGVNVHRSGSYGVYVAGGSPKLRNLVVHHNTSEGIRVDASSASGPVEVVHSTLVSNGLVGIHARLSGSSLQLVVKDSIVARHPNFGIWNEGLAGSVEATYNDVVGSAAGHYGNVSAGVGSIAANPLFVDEPYEDYRLQPASPCVDAGVATGLATDADGRPRAVDGNLAGGAEPDMGAYERAGGNAAPTAVAGGDRTVAVGVSTSFDATGSSDADGTVVSWHWTFGDGASADGATAAHAYASAGTYTASLTVTDDDGATATDSLVVTVVGTDTAAPAIVHTPVPDGRQAGVAIAISATVTDASGVASVTLHYRASGASAFTDIAMIAGAGDAFTADIPGVAVAAAGVDYYLSAVDGAASPNAGTDPAGAPTSFHHFTVAAGPVPEEPSGGCGCGAGGGSPGALVLLAALLLRRRRASTGGDRPPWPA